MLAEMAYSTIWLQELLYRSIQVTFELLCTSDKSSWSCKACDGAGLRSAVWGVGRRAATCMLNHPGVGRTPAMGVFPKRQCLNFEYT